MLKNFFNFKAKFFLEKQKKYILENSNLKTHDTIEKHLKGIGTLVLISLILTSCKKPESKNKSLPLLGLLVLTAPKAVSGGGSGGGGSDPVPGTTATPVAPTISYTGSPFVYTPSISVNLVPTISGTGISNCTSSPALPAGLSINAATCAITGTATATQTATARTITITGNAGTATASINIAIGKRIFVTASNTANGNLGAGYSTGIEGADGICNGGDANKPSTGTYKALIVDGTSGNRRACSTANCGTGPNEGLDWVLSASTPYYRTDLTTLIAVTNANKIFSFNLSNPIQIAAAISWSSLQTDWLSSNTNCNQWTSNSGAVQGNLGDSSSTTSQVLSTGAAGSCNSTIRKLVCVEQ